MPRSDASIASLIAGSRSASFRRLNAHLLPGAPAVGGLPGPLAQPDAVRIGGGTDRSAQKGETGVGKSRRIRRPRRRSPLLRASLVVFSRHGHELDDDNLRGGCKLLRDAIAAWLGCDDSDRVIEWEYTQAHTRGREGVVVKIELIPQPD